MLAMPNNSFCLHWCISAYPFLLMFSKEGVCTKLSRKYVRYPLIKLGSAILREHEWLYQLFFYIM